MELVKTDLIGDLW